MNTIGAIISPHGGNASRCPPDSGTLVTIDALDYVSEVVASNVAPIVEDHM